MSDDYDPYEERMDHYAAEYDRKRDEAKGEGRIGRTLAEQGGPPNRASHPGRQVGRDTIGTYGQELEAWRKSDAAQTPQQGDYGAYMRSIGMGHRAPKE